MATARGFFAVLALAIGMGAQAHAADDLTDPNLTDERKIEVLTRVGKRNLDWLKIVNAANPLNPPIMVSDPKIRNAYPIEAPKTYSPTITWNTFQALLPTLSTTTRLVLSGELDPSAAALDVGFDAYTVALRAVEKLRQDAQRWSALVPFIGEYIDNQTQDIRGYWFFTKHTDYATVLPAYPVLSAELQAEYKKALLGICLNLEAATSLCQAQFDYYVARNELAKMAAVYLPKATRVFASYYRIENPRPEAYWDPAKNVLEVPVRMPVGAEHAVVRDFLVQNIEDEFRYGDWKLKLVDDPSSAIVFEFKPGEIPHVNALGGSFLTMDALIDLTEYSAQWTIRHEFGHVLGFPDCYIEFFDEEAKAFVNYQIDTTDLMCSRAGNLLPKHHDELERVYAP
jgi:hypothetical protein